MSGVLSSTRPSPRPRLWLKPRVDREKILQPYLCGTLLWMGRDTLVVDSTRRMRGGGWDGFAEIMQVNHAAPRPLSGGWFVQQM